MPDTGQAHGGKLKIPSSSGALVGTGQSGAAQIAATSLSLMAVIAAVWFLSWAKGLLIPLSFALFMALWLRPAVRLLARVHVPRAIGAALVLVALSAVVASGIDRTRGDAVRMIDQMPAAARYLRHQVNATLNDPSSLAHRIKMLTELGSTGTNTVAAAAQQGAAAAPAVFAQGTLQVFSLTSELAAMVFLIYLMLASGGTLPQRLARSNLLPVGIRRGASTTFAEIERALFHYLAVLIATNVLLGLCVWGAFHLFGVHYAGAWGIAAGIIHFVPYVGPAALAIGSGLAASMQFNSPMQGLVVAATTLGLSTLIGVVLQTWWSGRSVRMNTVAVFVSLVFWSWLWGLPGLLLGTPLTMVLKILCSRVRCLAWVDALLDAHHRDQSIARRTVLRTVQRVMPH